MLAYKSMACVNGLRICIFCDTMMGVSVQISTMKKAINMDRSIIILSLKFNTQYFSTLEPLSILPRVAQSVPTDSFQGWFFISSIAILL